MTTSIKAKIIKLDRRQTNEQQQIYKYASSEEHHQEVRNIMPSCSGNQVNDNNISYNKM